MQTGFALAQIPEPQSQVVRRHHEFLSVRVAGGGLDEASTQQKELAFGGGARHVPNRDRQKVAIHLAELTQLSQKRFRARKLDEADQLPAKRLAGFDQHLDRRRSKIRQSAADRRSQLKHAVRPALSEASQRSQGQVRRFSCAGCRGFLPGLRSSQSLSVFADGNQPKVMGLPLALNPCHTGKPGSAANEDREHLQARRRFPHANIIAPHPG